MGSCGDALVPFAHSDGLNTSPLGLGRNAGAFRLGGYNQAHVQAVLEPTNAQITTV
jgi:hypothetical protein